MLIPFVPVLSLASSITVVNPSFEIQPGTGLPFSDSTGSWSLGVNIPGWISSDPANSGEFQPVTQGAPPPFNSLDNGPTSAWVRQGTTLSQTVGALVQLGAEYTLLVDVAWRNDKATNGTADLLINGNRYMATGPTLVRGDWTTLSATYVATSADVGAPITIELNANTYVWNTQGNFDNVRLDDPAVPEPALGGVVGACFIGLILRRRACRR
jgi:hypothetical protein